MATISTRVEESVKIDAERIADQIGIPISTAVNIFLKRFIAEKGFPFPVVVGKEESCAPFRLKDEELDAVIKKAVADPDNSGHPDQFTYMDDSKRLTTIQKED